MKKDNNDTEKIDFNDVFDDPDVTSLEELREPEDNGIFDQDADNPPAGTPGHPGIDEDTA